MEQWVLDSGLITEDYLVNAVESNRENADLLGNEGIERGVLIYAATLWQAMDRATATEIDGDTCTITFENLEFSSIDLVFASTDTVWVLDDMIVQP